LRLQILYAILVQLGYRNAGAFPVSTAMIIKRMTLNDHAWLGSRLNFSRWSYYWLRPI